MLYILEHTERLDDRFVEAALPFLSLQRLQMMDQRRMLLDKVNTAAVYLLLRHALKREYGFSEAPEFVFGHNGKPYLKKTDGVFFNFSHCRCACACILSEKETAVDIADRRKISFSTAAYFCSEEELRLAKEEKEPQAMLLRLWCQKECCSKGNGAGLSANFKKLKPEEVPSLHTIETPGYVLSYLGEEELSPIVFRPEELLDL